MFGVTLWESFSLSLSILSSSAHSCHLSLKSSALPLPLWPHWFFFILWKFSQTVRRPPHPGSPSQPSALQNSSLSLPSHVCTPTPTWGLAQVVLGTWVSLELLLHVNRHLNFVYLLYNELLCDFSFEGSWAGQVPSSHCPTQKSCLLPQHLPAILQKLPGQVFRTHRPYFSRTHLSPFSFSPALVRPVFSVEPPFRDQLQSRTPGRYVPITSTQWALWILLTLTVYPAPRGISHSPNCLSIPALYSFHSLFRHVCIVQKWLPT